MAARSAGRYPGGWPVQPDPHGQEPYGAGGNAQGPYDSDAYGPDGPGSGGPDSGGPGPDTRAAGDGPAARPAPSGADPLSAGRAVRTLRALSGSVAAGLVLLAIGIVVVSILGGRRGIPGPGTESLVVHLVAAFAGLVLQRLSDRRTGVLAVAGSAAVLCTAAAVLWTQWWG